jgi:hypothetical protein
MPGPLHESGVSRSIATQMKATTRAASGRLFSFEEGRVAAEQAAMEVKRLQIPCCLQEIRPSTLSSSSRGGASFRLRPSGYGGQVETALRASSATVLFVKRAAISFYL